MTEPNQPVAPAMTPKEAIANERRAKAELEAALLSGDVARMNDATALLEVAVAEKDRTLVDWEKFHAGTGDA